jgi:hypothetical protein
MSGGSARPSAKKTPGREVKDLTNHEDVRNLTRIAAGPVMKLRRKLFRPSSGEIVLQRPDFEVSALVGLDPLRSSNRPR